MSVQYRGSTQVFSAVDLTQNQTSTIYAQNGAMLQASVIFDTSSSTGTPNGTLYVDVSNDKLALDQQTASSAAWLPLVPAGQTTAGIAVTTKTVTGFSWVNAYLAYRVRWVNSASGANSTATAYAYGISG